MDNKTIELHTIATFQGKEYELENLLNGLLNKSEEKDKEIERLNNIINELDNLISIKIIRETNEFDYHININDMVELKTRLLALKEGKNE